MNKYLPNKLTLLSAVLLAVSNPLWSIGFLSFISLVPFLYMIQQQNSFKSMIKESVWLQLIFAASLFFWVPPSVQKLWPQTNHFTNGLCFILFLLLVECHVIIWALLRYKVRHWNPWLLMAASALAYMLLDDYTFKFVKDSLGHNLYDHYSIKQLAHYIGVYGLTCFIVLVNEMFFWSIKEFKKWKLLVPVLSLVMAYSIGSYLLAQPIIGTKMNLTMVQPNFQFNNPKRDSMSSNDYKLFIGSEIIRLTEEALRKYPENKNIVWPETVYPIYFYSPDTIADEAMNLKIKQLVKTNNINLFFGSSKRENGVLNSNVYIMLSVNEQGEVVDEYHTKNKLFPFGEEIPWTDTFPILKSWFPRASVSFKTDQVKIGRIPQGPTYGVQICYESVTTDITNRYRKHLPQIIMNPTNESSFISWGEPQLALALSSFRAVEIKRPFIRVADTGISGYIDIKGIVHNQTKMDEQEISNLEIIVPDDDKP